MPSLGSGYSVADFLRRLQSSPVSHMAGHYHENRLLFIHRQDFFVKAIMSLSWDRGVALLRAAYHAQSLSPHIYRALLARMVLHNQYVTKQQREAAGTTPTDTWPPCPQTGVETSGASASREMKRSPSSSSSSAAAAPHRSAKHVPWRVAMEVYTEAMQSYGTQCPTQLARSALRLLAPHKTWRAALSILQLEQANDRLSKGMLIDAARVCATAEAWETALALLHHVHHQDDDYLADAIKALRPPGTDALTLEQAKHSLLPAHSAGNKECVVSARQRHVIAVLADVTAAVPWETALSVPLCRSFCSHLVASTTLAEESKAILLTTALRQLPWFAAKQILLQDTVPRLMLLPSTTNPLYLSKSKVDAHGVENQEHFPAPDSSAPSHSIVPGSESSTCRSSPRGKGKEGKERKGSRRRSRGVKTKGARSIEELKGELRKGEASPIPGRSRGDDDESDQACQSMEAMLPDTLLSALQDAPSTLSVLLASMVDKLPSASMAVAFLREVRRRGREWEREGQHDDNRIAYATQLPVVRRALLRRCVASPAGWRVAVPLLLEGGDNFNTTPPALLSELVRQLREAGEVRAAVRLLQGHVIPSRSQLEPWAMTMAMECILSYNQWYYRVMKEGEVERARGAIPDDKASAVGEVSPLGKKGPSFAASPSPAARHDEYPPHPHRGRGHMDSEQAQVTLPILQEGPVEWQTALTLLLQGQVQPAEGRVRRTGTGPSAGAVSPRPTAERETTETCLTPAQLRLSVCLCVHSGSCLGAIKLLGHARRVNRTTLPLSREITALLYCMHYNRFSEALALLAQAERRHGTTRVLPLWHMLSLYLPWKGRVTLPRRSCATRADGLNEASLKKQKH